MGTHTYEDLKNHVGDKIVCVSYGLKGQEPVNIAFECETCYEVLMDYDYLDECKKDDVTPWDCPSCQLECICRKASQDGADKIDPENGITHFDFIDRKRHIGHELKCKSYGDAGKDPYLVTLECETCNEEVMRMFGHHECSVEGHNPAMCDECQSIKMCQVIHKLYPEKI